MMENGLKKTFECPEGFEQEAIESSQLYFEDLDEDSDLWLVRMPKSADVSALENQTFNLDGETYTLTTDGGMEYDCVADSRKIPNICLLLPQTESKKLSCVNKTFKGSIYVTEVSRCKPAVKMEPSSAESLSVADLSLNANVSVENGETPHKKKKSHKKSKHLSANGFKKEPSSD